MSTLQELFEQKGAMLFQNESIALDHYYLEPYQDANDEDSDVYNMDSPFETDESKKKRRLCVQSRPFSLFKYFMDGSRRTYKVGDLVIPGRKIYPVIAAQVRAGCVERNRRKVNSKELFAKNYLLLSDSFNEVNYDEIKRCIDRCDKFNPSVTVEKYSYMKSKDSSPNSAAIAKANSLMHQMEVDILSDMVKAEILETDKMLIVDGPLQFLAEDSKKDEFADLFYNVVGVSKSFDPNLPTSDKRSSSHVGAFILDLKYGERTPVFRKKNSMMRVFGFWYLRIRKRTNIKNPLDGIIKVEKMAIREDIKNGFNTDVIDNISLSLLAEGIPTCHGRDNRWASHLYPIYMAETMIKSTFSSDIYFINQFQRNVFK